MSEPGVQFVPEDFGKPYQLYIDWDDIPHGTHVYLAGYFTRFIAQPGWVPGEVVNGETYILPEDFVQLVENRIGSPFSYISVPSSCVISVIEE